MEEDTVRAMVGVAFLALSIRTSVRMLRRAIDGVRKES
jgi:hypothetical protein